MNKKETRTISRFDLFDNMESENESNGDQKVKLTNRKVSFLKPVWYNKTANEQNHLMLTKKHTDLFSVNSMFSNLNNSTTHSLNIGQSACNVGPSVSVKKSTETTSQNLLINDDLLVQFDPKLSSDLATWKDYYEIKFELDAIEHKINSLITTLMDFSYVFYSGPEKNNPTS